MSKKSKKRAGYIRLATFSINEILELVLAQTTVDHQLREKYTYSHPEWKKAGKSKFAVRMNGELQTIKIGLRSHRYKLFATKGVVCRHCGFKGEYFALERSHTGSPESYHFNLYGRDRHGNEIMLTKDHVTPKSKGGRNSLENYQVLCQPCNVRKGNK